MAKRGDRKQPGGQLAQGTETSDTRIVPILVRFQGELLEITPSAEHPLGVLLTDTFEEWISGLTDLKTNTRLTNAVAKMRRGLFGDWKEIGSGVFESRLDFGPGYRIDYARHGRVVVILLGGGEKSSQRKDIVSALQLWEEVRNEIADV